MVNTAPAMRFSMSVWGMLRWPPLSPSPFRSAVVHWASVLSLAASSHVLVMSNVLPLLYTVP